MCLKKALALALERKEQCMLKEDLRMAFLTSTDQKAANGYDRRACEELEKLLL